MATTLTKSTGTVALSGAAEKVTLPASYGWVWVKNMSEGDIFAGLSADISEGADGVLTIPAGECGRVQTDGFSSVYLLGTGNALVVAQNYADCPFKVGGKGGEIPDLSAYAKKSDIPTALPANGGNADNATNAILLNGKPYSNYVNYLGVLQVDDISSTPSDVYEYTNDSTYSLPYEVSVSPLISEFIGLPTRWWNIKYYPYGYGNGLSCQTAFPVGFGNAPFIRYSENGVWSDWKEIYTSGNKPYVTGTATVEANSTTCTPNHGFIPSGVIWWDVYASGIGLGLSETSFNMACEPKPVNRTVNYLIFK